MSYLDNHPFLADGRITPGEYMTLVDIECSLGLIWGQFNTTDQVRRDAGKLADAIRTLDFETAAKIERRYAPELPKGDCTGGPKEIKPGNASKKILARTAIHFRYNTILYRMQREEQ